MRYKMKSVEQGMRVSELVWSLMTNGNSSTKYLFLVEQDANGQAYADIDENMECPIFLNENTSAILEELGQLLEIPKDEGSALKDMILSNQRILLKNIIPNNLIEA